MVSTNGSGELGRVALQPRACTRGADHARSGWIHLTSPACNLAPHETPKPQVAHWSSANSKRPIRCETGWASFPDTAGSRLRAWQTSVGSQRILFLAHAPYRQLGNHCCLRVTVWPLPFGPKVMPISRWGSPRPMRTSRIRSLRPEMP